MSAATPDARAGSTATRRRTTSRATASGRARRRGPGRSATGAVDEPTSAPRSTCAASGRRTTARRLAAAGGAPRRRDASPATTRESTREKEIVAPPERRAAEEFVAEIRIVRHGITQGYSTDAGLTPMGGWQAHQRGHSLSKSLKEGQRVRIVCADTNRARQTAEQLHRGMLDGMDAVAAQGRRDRARGDPRAAQLRRLDPGRAARRHLGVPPVPGDDGEARADGGRRPAALAGRDRPLLPHPAGRGRPDPRCG